MFLTDAGKKLAEYEDVASVIRYQVLRTQFPSPYSQGAEVDISSSVKVRPAIFLYEMLLDKRLDGVITNLDVAIACIYGRTHKDVKRVVTKCITARSVFKKHQYLTPKDRKIKALSTILENPQTDLLTKRTVKKIHKKSWDTDRLIDTIHIANTLINRMRSAGLLIKIIAPTTPFNIDAFKLNTQLEGEIKEVKKERLVHKNNKDLTGENWQKRLGRYEKHRSGKTTFATKYYDLSDPEQSLKEAVLIEYFQSRTLFDHEAFCTKFAKEKGLRADRALELLKSVLPHTKTDIESQLFTTGSTKGRANEFEKNIHALLLQTLPFCDVRHTGQLKRQDKSETSRDYPDVVINTPDHHCIMFDAKNTSDKKGYSFSANDQSACREYVAVPGEVLGNKTDCKIYAFIVVAHAFKGQSLKRALICEEQAGIPFILMTITELIELTTSEIKNSSELLKRLNSYADRQRA